MSDQTTQQRVTVSIIDQRTGTKTTVKVPANVPIKRLLPVLVAKLGLPAQGPGGEQQKYDMALEDGEGGEQLEENETLAEAGVTGGAVLRIIPDMTGGASEKPERFFTLRIHGPDESVLFQTDFPVYFFEEYIRGLVQEMVMLKLFYNGEQYKIRVFPHNDLFYNEQPQVLQNDVSFATLPGEGYMDIVLPECETEIARITYLNFQLHSVERHLTYSINFKINAHLESLLLLVVQAMVDGDIVKPGEVFSYSLAARAGTDFQVHPLLAQQAQTKAVDVPQIPKFPLSGKERLPLSSGRMEANPFMTETGTDGTLFPQSSNTLTTVPLPNADEALPIEIEVESIEYLVQPVPKSINSYTDAEVVGKVRPADMPIYFRRSAWKRVLVAAQESKRVDEEVGGFLVGNAYRDPETDRLFVEIAEVVIADKAQGTSLSINFDYQAWRQVIDKLNHEFPGKCSMGWYHTHLICQSKLILVDAAQNSYKVNYQTFFSQADVFVHRNFFPDPWHVALVIDLKRKGEVLFVWRDGRIAPVGGFYLYGD